MGDEVTIDRLGAQGDGVAEGGTLFVPFTLPGERVRVIRQGTRARLAAVLEPAPDRIAPVCSHFSTCGGCALQHASDDFVAGWKREMVAAALASRGIADVEIRTTRTSPPASRRRITLSARRTRKGSCVGFHEGQSEALVSITECPVANPSLPAAIPALNELVERAASRKGEVRITLTASEGGVDAAVEGVKPLDGPGRALLAGVAARAGLARLAVAGEVVVTLKDPAQTMGRARVIPPPGGFLQATREGEDALAAAVREAVGDAPRIADLFAGCGTFALRLAETAEVHAVEAEGPALAALDAAWRQAQGLRRVTTERRNLFHRPLLAAELGRFAAVVMDPPRAGANAQAERLAGAGVPRLAMVSCNPATFARDARILVDGGYRIDWVQPVDQFRWSSHVELVAAMSRR
ncbi:class I SAM-dependent RNA methyltransferase [Limibaculum sp. M0105]|uniref:Class I SAM-dependent RNA methyltransferase n=1 Tax=Thermohalobaculum xanthum TaxID=2753746 RepID=A0A8J7MBM5_9RHOB|nr:class I SAM-dependent RNA methyltransferase [Thermohalobaculum xanthum]MBK0401272.1 class I SAM-dependent RNA methyltransferase [Thermohalobaculum xanthum]